MAHFHAEFCGDKHLVALAFEPVADMDFRFAGRVDIGGIDKVDAGLDGLVEHFGRLRLVAAPTEIVGAEADERYFEAGVAELTVLHNL